MEITNDLLESITEKRNEMFKTAQQRGMKNNETVKRSKELDRLIITYQKLALLEKTGT